MTEYGIYDFKSVSNLPPESYDAKCPYLHESCSMMNGWNCKHCKVVAEQEADNGQADS